MGQLILDILHMFFLTPFSMGDVVPHLWSLSCKRNTSYNCRVKMLSAWWWRWWRWWRRWQRDGQRRDGIRRTTTMTTTTTTATMTTTMAQQRWWWLWRWRRRLRLRRRWWRRLRRRRRQQRQQRRWPTTMVTTMATTMAVDDDDSILTNHYLHQHSMLPSIHNHFVCFFDFEFFFVLARRFCLVLYVVS